MRQLFPLLTYSLLLAAVQKGFDVFNALDLMENKTFLEKLKFGIGDGNLQYYLYNWKCPSMGAEKVRKLLGLPRPGSWWSKGRAWVWDPASVWALVSWCSAPCKPPPSMARLVWGWQRVGLQSHRSRKVVSSFSSHSESLQLAGGRALGLSQGTLQVNCPVSQEV